MKESKYIPDRDRLCPLPFAFSPDDDEQSIEIDGREAALDLLALLLNGADAEAFLAEGILN
jgi:hypothetical protein